MTGGGNIREQVKAYVAQIEMTEAEIAELNADKSETYKSAKEAGLDVAALRNVIAYRRKRAKHGAAAMESAEQAVAEYLAYLGDGTSVATRVHAHEVSASASAECAVESREDGRLAATPPAPTPEARPADHGGTAASVDATMLLPPGLDEHGHMLEDIPTFLRRVQ